ncbi:hypothetical protein NUSPORA_02532 [Nucleospora cyclopteri]
MVALCRKLNKLYPKVYDQMDNKYFTTAHLLFNDDLELFNVSDESIVDETKMSLISLVLK